MRSSPFWLILVGIMILLDFYVFQAIRLVSQSAGPKTRLAIFITYWVISVLAIVLIMVLPAIQFSSKSLRSIIFALLVAFFFAKLVAGVFLLIDDLRRLIQWGAGKLWFRNTEGEQIQESEGISRSVFLTWAGLVAGAGLFGSLVWGFTNKYRYKVRRVALNFPNLPASFKGLRIVQLSDIHSGSFNDKEAVLRGVEKVLSLKPDLILFTGDLVNDVAGEMENYKDVFSRLKAPMGVFSVLGNHDYGDYVQWETPEQKRQNLETLKQLQGQMGWRLLMNEHVVLERAGEKIALLGVENWGNRARFPKYGRLAEAHAGTEGIPFKILMSHDPSHWDGEVRQKYPDIDLTLSGHTHGMQFGVELPWLRWSPVQYVYKQWAGLYEEENQKLYVNRGFGFIGYPGRVGILPEITVFEL
jgi:predicted MPP superfamily phosphohydrolase